MLCCTWHLNTQCTVWSVLSTQCTINFEHSNALSTQCTRSNAHSALSATHLLGTKVPVWALCVVPCARESRRPPWASLSLSLPLTRALPRLDLSVSVLSCDIRRYMPKPSGANWNGEIECLLYDSHQKGKMMIMTTKTSGSQVDSPVAEGKRKEGGERKMRDLHKDT